MSDTAIHVEDVSKRYPSASLRAGSIGQREPYKVLQDVLPAFISAPFCFTFMIRHRGSEVGVWPVLPLHRRGPGADGGSLWSVRDRVLRRGRAEVSIPLSASRDLHGEFMHNLRIIHVNLVDKSVK